MPEQPLTEEIRARHTAVLRALITTFRAAGDVDSVIRPLPRQLPTLMRAGTGT